MLLTAAVIVFAVVGYLLLKINERRNAALREHDSAIHDLVVEKLQSSSALQGRGRNITVSVNADAVTLGGSVPSPGDKDDAANEVREVPGVSGVINNIVVTASLPSPQASSPEKGTASALPPETPPVSPPPKRQSRASDTGNTAKAGNLIRHANQQLDNGNYNGAIADFVQALRLDPNNSDAVNGLIRARRAQKAEESLPKQ